MIPDNRILTVEGLHIAFGGPARMTGSDGQPFAAVKGLSFHLNKGRTLAVAGESGSGKSLTAFSLMGLLPRGASASGTATLHTANENRQLLSANYPKDVRGKHAGMVFQEPMSSLNPVMKIGKQLQEAITAHQQLSGKDARQLAIDWLAKVQLPNPEQLFDRYPHELSGGQKQRVVIAMAMCNHPALLIADEPTTALDVTVQQEVIRLMQYLQEQHGTAMIFITHDLALARMIADDILVMYKGEAVEYGAAEQIFNTPQHPYTKALLACRPSPEHKGLILPSVTDIMNGNELENEQPYPTSTGTETLIAVDDLKVWFPGPGKEWYRAVDNVSFTINKGETLGLAGESGCGKSTISKAMMGLVPVKEGHIMFDGKDLATLPPREWRTIRRDIQMIFQDPYSSLNPRMTIGDALKEPLAIHNIVPASELQKEVSRLLNLVQLPTEAAKKYPHEFSGGQRQRIGIARALALRPRMLICDESVSALDVSIQAQVLNLLKELQNELGLTYLFISHDLGVVHYISDRVMIMQSGKIVESGTANDVLLHPQNAYTQKLVAAIPRH